MNNDKKTDGRQSHLLRIAEDKHITRRDFMQYAAALGITATAATSLWSDKALAAPKRGGHLRVGSEGWFQHRFARPPACHRHQSDQPRDHIDFRHADLSRRRRQPGTRPV